MADVQVAARDRQRAGVQVLQRPGQAARQHVGQDNRQQQRRAARPAISVVLARRRAAASGSRSTATPSRPTALRVDVLELPEGHRIGWPATSSGTTASRCPGSVGTSCGTRGPDQPRAGRRHERRRARLAAAIDDDVAPAPAPPSAGPRPGRRRAPNHRAPEQAQRRIDQRQAARTTRRSPARSMLTVRS